MFSIAYIITLQLVMCSKHPGPPGHPLGPSRDPPGGRDPNLDDPALVGRPLLLFDVKSIERSVSRKAKKY